MSLEKSNELLSPEEVGTCQQNVRSKWYSMPLEVFTSFIFKQEIAAAGDAGVRKYHENTTAEEVADTAIASAMRSSTKDFTEKLYKKMSKIVAVANPALGLEWLSEIERH